MEADPRPGGRKRGRQSDCERFCADDFVARNSGIGFCVSQNVVVSVVPDQIPCMRFEFGNCLCFMHAPALIDAADRNPGESSGSPPLSQPRGEQRERSSPEEIRSILIVFQLLQSHFSVPQLRRCRRGDCIRIRLPEKLP